MNRTWYSKGAFCWMKMSPQIEILIEIQQYIDISYMYRIGLYRYKVKLYWYNYRISWYIDVSWLFKIVYCPFSYRTIYRCIAIHQRQYIDTSTLQLIILLIVLIQMLMWYGGTVEPRVHNIKKEYFVYSSWWNLSWYPSHGSHHQ